MKTRRRVIATLIAAVATVSLLAGCSGLSAFGESLNRSFSGVSATMTTYTAGGDKIDEVHGTSFEVSRDTRFDSTDSDGNDVADSEVLMISVGNSHISHVGSSLIMAQDGLTDLTPSIGTKIKFTNNDPGTPWLNNLLEYNRNLWHGKAKTIMIRSQNGYPIAVYAGNEVNILATDVPKSTWFRVDGKYLFVYRADYTVYDNDLLTQK